MLKNLYRSLSFSLLISALTIFSVNALPASYFTQESKLSSGKWVKIKVTENGMQELTFNQLRDLGFQDPEKVAVFGYPSWTMGSYLFDTNLPDDLPAVPTAIYGNKLVFYADAYTHSQLKILPFTKTGSYYYRATFDRNLDGNESYYYLTDSCEPTAVEVSNVEASDAEPVKMGMGFCVNDFRKRGVTSSSYNHWGAYLMGENLAANGGTLNLELPSLINSGTPVVLTAGVATYTISNSHKFTVGFATKSSNLNPSNGNSNKESYKNYYYNTVELTFTGINPTSDGIYPLSLKFYQNYDLATELSWEHFVITYPRSTVLSSKAQDVIAFTSIPTAQAVSLSGTTDATHVWNISDSMNPIEMAITDIVGDARGIVANRAYYASTSSTGMKIVAFDPTRALNKPQIVGEVENQNLHAIDVPEMLIVTSQVNLKQAERLAQLHELYTNTDVKVITYDQICNEFGSGSRHPMALRRMVKMLYDRDPDRFKALLIMARAPRDNTGAFENETPEQFNSIYIPMLHCEDVSIYNSINRCAFGPTAYGTDAIYGLLNDNFTYNQGQSSSFLTGKPDIQVGRIPAYNEGEAIAYVNKAERYLVTPSDAALWNNAIILTDKGDKNMHIEQGKTLHALIDNYSPSTTIISYSNAFENRDATANRVKAALSRGVAYWAFLGHAAITTIPGWTTTIDQDFSFANPPFVNFLTCQTLVMDHPSTSLQTEMLLNENGGMIAGVGAIRPVFAECNLGLGKMCAYGFYSQEPGATFGQVWKTARSVPSTYPSLIDGYLNTVSHVNSMSYNLAGDPMLPLRNPSGSVKFTSINGNAPEGSLEFTSFENHEVEGAVYNPDGSVDETFDGTVTVQVYDGNFAYTLAGYTDSNNNVVPATELPFDDWLLQEVKFDVKGGRFSGNLAFALPHHQGDYNRVTLFAQSTDLNHTAVGMLDNVKILPDVDYDYSGHLPAEISQLYLVSPDFEEGDCIGANFTMYADVKVGSLPLVGKSDHVGGGMSVILDDHKRYPYVDSYFTVDTEGNGKLAFPIHNLTDGLHTLTFSVSDIAGETVSRSINFIVANVTEGVVKIDKDFCTDQVEIDVEHGYDLATTGRVVVTNPAGKVVFTHENAAFPFTWDLVDINGDHVAPGVYSAHVYFKAERRYGFAAPARIIVGK